MKAWNRSVCIGIVGTRKRFSVKDYYAIEDKFNEIREDGCWIVSGGCSKGGDYFAEKLARETATPIIIFHANWERDEGSAGFVRNTYIAEWSDYLIACVSVDRKGGTEDTINKFIKIDPNNINKLYLV